jgi:hypothetical protein
VSIPSSELASSVPLWFRGEGQHSLAGEGAGGANSDDWRESLALCILRGLKLEACSNGRLNYYKKKFFSNERMVLSSLKLSCFMAEAKSIFIQKDLLFRF